MLSLAEDECFANVPHDFLICTTIHKARKVGIFTGQLFVRVTLDGTHRSTRTFSNSENPYFNEYFVFELRCTLNELLRQTLLYELRRQTPCKKNSTHGELLIDLQSVWNQPNRSYFKKWGRLETPISDGSDKRTGSGNDSAAGGKNTTTGDGGQQQQHGFLQIDLAIVSQATNPDSLMRSYEGDVLALSKWQINQDYDDIEKNLLQNLDPSVQCNIVYVVTFYRGIFTRRSDYFVQFRFNPFKGKTSVRKATHEPEWLEAVSYAWMYPSLAQTLVLQIMSREHLQWKCIADYELHFDDVAFKAKPSLGPAYLHLYDPHNTARYVGRLLVELRSECVGNELRRELTYRNVTAIDEVRWWKQTTFHVEFLAVQGDFMHGNMSNCKLSLRMAEYISNQVECYLKSYPMKQRRINNLKYFRQEMPYKAISLRTIQADNRHKLESDFFIQEILDYMKTEIETFKLFQLKYTTQMQTKCFKAIIIAIQNKIHEGVLGKRLEYAGQHEVTTWDTQRLIYIQEFFKRFPDELRNLRQKLRAAHTHHIEQTIEEVLQDLVRYSNELANLLAMTRLQDEWPDLLLVISVTGNKDIAVCRLNAKHYVSAIPGREENARGFCWRVRNFVFKDPSCQHSCAHCGCTVAIVNGCLGIVEDSERSDYLTALAPQWKQTETLYWTPSTAFSVYRCRLYIHQGKVRPGSDRTGLADAYVRVVFGAQAAETPMVSATLSPTWNLVITFEGIVFCGSVQLYTRNQPLMAVELYDTDRHSRDDYLGSGLLAVAVVLPHDMAEPLSPDTEPIAHRSDIVKTKNAFQKFQQLKTLSPPPLKWVPIANHGSVRAEILMSAEMVEVRGEEAEHSVVVEPSLTIGIPSSIKPNMRNFVLEVVFAGFRNYTKSSMGSKHRVKVMMGDLMLSSGLSTGRIKNSINFLMLYTSGVVNLPEQLEYWPAIIITDVSVSSRNIETIVGAALISNSRRFLQRNTTTKCTPRVQFEDTSSPGSTTLHMEDEETSMLLGKEDQRPGKISRLIGGLKTRRLSKLSSVKIPTRLKGGEEPAIAHEFNWWTKFYNSLQLNDSGPTDSKRHVVAIYPDELEKQVDFNYLIDWAEPVRMVHGVKYKKNALPKDEVYTTLKLQVKITQCLCNPRDCGDGPTLRPLQAALNPKYQAQVETLAELTKIVARIYIVQGQQFRPHDKHSQSDSYVRLNLGSKTISNRAHYIPNQSNPIYGKCFELEGTLPRDHMLEVTVFDRNSMRDDIIGSTHIDLEDRWRTRHRATVGLAREYSRSGYNKWRDIVTPFEILSNYCTQHNLKEPVFKGNSIELDGAVFADATRVAVDEEQQQRLALTALHNFDSLPTFGYKLIPEHVETRSLYRDDCPGIEQGKLQLWVELYEGNLNIPAPIDITPQPPKAYELRVTIYNCADIVLDEKNIFGKYMSDIFVKGWCTDAGQAQSTDIHYRSLNGEASFNWRMLFPLKYSSVDGMMVVKRGGGLYEEYDMKLPPVLYLQVWDNDVISKDDFLGALEINLNNFTQPFDTAKACTAATGTGQSITSLRNPFHFAANTQHAVVNLFTVKKVRGWLPLQDRPKRSASPSENRTTTGKIELELQVVNEADAAARPVGLARNPPDALPPPVRPDTSFNPWLHPLQSIKRILWPSIRKYVFMICVFAILIVLGITALYMLPALLAHFV